MQAFTATASNKANRLRVSIDGVQIMSLARDTNGEVKQKRPAGWHTLSWDALGNEGEKYEVTLDTPAGQQCRHEGEIGTQGIDHGSCPFILF